jgi:hypothetical protein
MQDRTIPAFLKGIHNKFDDEIIEVDALVDSKGWVVRNGVLEVARGRELLGDTGVAGSVSDIHRAYKVNGDSVFFKKSGTTVKALVAGVWTDAITGLTENAPTVFANYSSLAGAFVYVFSTDGIWKIVTANPTSSTPLYNAAKNFKGIGFIENGRTILWGRVDDKTGIYGSKIDAQNSTVYTSVTSEALADVASGTLAFKAEGATRTCFAVQITDTSSGEVFRDNFDGTLTGSISGTGTINYTTGAFTITGQTGAGTANYQWEDTNTNSLTDFTKSAPRVAGEGFQFPQDIGGDAIKIAIPYEGQIFTFKEQSVYQLNLTEDDTNATNEVFRTNIGIPTSKSAVPTSKGIVYIDTANGDEITIKLLAKNPLGDTFDTAPIFAHYEFSKFEYEDAAMGVYGDFVMIACKTKDATANDTILMCDYINNTVMVLPYSARCFCNDGESLYTGDSLSTSAYKILNGFDDLGNEVTNYAISKGDTFGTDVLKKIKRLRFRGLISTQKSIEIYGSFDRSSYTLLGTIFGGASYVDTENPNTIGLNLIGVDVIGGSDAETAYPYFCEIKIKTPKFRKRYIKLIHKGYGYASIQMQTDRDIWTFDNKMPKPFREKANVSLDGTETNLDTPQF